MELAFTSTWSGEKMSLNRHRSRVGDRSSSDFDSKHDGVRLMEHGPGFAPGSRDLQSLA